MTVLLNTYCSEIKYKRERILELFLEGKKLCEILCLTQKLGINRMCIYRTISPYNKRGSVQPVNWGGSQRSVWTKKMIKVIRERIRRNPRQSQRKLDRKLKVSLGTINNIIHRDLRLKVYKRQNVHGLTALQIQKRYDRSKELRTRHDPSTILFSDEKMFLLQQPHNSQNDRVYSVSLQNIDPKLYLFLDSKMLRELWFGVLCQRKGVYP